MNKTESATTAQTLLRLLRPNDGVSPPTDGEAENTLTKFVCEIQSLDSQHNKNKIINQKRLDEQVYRRDPTFKQDKHALPYFRYQLRVASEELSSLVVKMRKLGNGNITIDVLNQFSEILWDYLFDLRDILEFLQSNDNNWSFFEGGQNRGVSSWEVFHLAKGLAYQSTFKDTGAPFDHKTAQIASLFILRQAMELRFERLIGVYPYNRKKKPPKLRHGFHRDFISNNRNFFDDDDVFIEELRHLYDWCSEIVHQAYQPYAWQISMAFRRAGSLLQSRSVPSGQTWSIYNSVTIHDVDKMQAAYEEHFLNTYEHGEWCFTRKPPEAQLPHGNLRQITTSSEYRPVRKRSNSRWYSVLLNKLYPKRNL